VAYIVDGVPIGDPLGGEGQIGANLSLVSGSIQEIQIIKDGFDPEYGNALSGIVNIRSRTGSKDNTRLNFQYITDDLGDRSLNKYSRNYDYVRMSLSGPDPLLSNRILPSLGLNFLKDQEFTYYIYADMDKNDGFYQMDDYDTPATKRAWSAFRLFNIAIPERLFNRYTFLGNFKFRPRQNLKFIVSYKQWYLKQTRFSWKYRYSNATAPVYTNERQSLSVEVTQAVTKDMNYEAILSVMDLETTLMPGDPDHPGKTLEPDQFQLESEWEDFTDRNGNGVYDPPEPLINIFPDTAVYGTNFSGPAYTLGEFNYEVNVQAGTPQTLSNFRFNDNGFLDNLEGEAFIDLNNNGVWDAGDILQDKNGNGILDPGLVSNINNRTQEPFIDGDSVIGEPFTDLNANGVYDVGIDIFVLNPDPAINQDLNHNGRHDGPHDLWSEGIPYEDRNGNGVYDFFNGRYDIGEPFTDVNGNGRYDLGGQGSFLDPGNHEDTATWQNTRVRTWRGELKVVRQIGRHEVKAGFSMQQDELKYQNIQRPYLPYTGRPDTTAPYPTRGAFRDFYDYNPLRGTVYLRDKIEYGSMIASLGLRWDFFLQDTEDLAQTLRSDDRGGLIQGDRQKISPRIGFSYPISDKAKVYFNYGHFFQLPLYTRMYARNTSSVNQNDILGNPNLDYQKTIQYSFGVKYAMSESYSIDVQGYFKDEFDKINSFRVQEGALYRQQYRNSDYGRSRGFELTMEKRGGGYVNGQVSYTYAFAYGKDSQANENYQEEFERSREPLTETPLDNDIRHSLKSAIQIYMPTTVKPRLFGVPIPNGWSLAIESVIESGSPFTPTKDFPNISQTGLEDIERNSMRYPATAVFDIRFAKEFQLAGLDWEFITWVENLFDNRNVVWVYKNTGRADTRQNQSQIIRGGTDYDQNPYNIDYGRQIRVGLELTI
jgi:outer membrane receptor protein involved in Fe transport